MNKKSLCTFLITICAFSSFSQLNNGLVAKYSFNNGNALDEINSNHGTVNGASLTTDRFGNANKAYQFDGIDDYIIAPHTSNIDLNTMTNGVSISFWVNPNSLPSSGLVSLITKWNGFTSEQYGVFMDAFGNNVSAIRMVNSNGLTDNAAMTSGNWYHVVFTYDMATTQHIITVNNVITQNVTPGGTYTPSTDYTSLSFGAQAADLNGGIPSPWRYFNGKLDDVRIYNRVLTAQEIDSLYNEANPNTIINLNEGLVAKYYFNDGNANDESGNANHGTINSAVTTTDRFGNANHAFEFGQNQTISVNDADTLDNFSSGMAISFWMNSPDISTNTNPLITKFSYCGGGFDAYNIRLNTNGAIWSQIDDESGLDSYQFSSVTIDNSTWHHVVLVWERPNVYYYIDGVLDASATTTSFNSDISNSPNNLMFGHIDPDFCGSTYDYNEKLDDIRIYNRTLNALEIDSLFNEPNPAFASVNENEKVNILKVFPNPSNGIITIQTEHPTSIEISDLTGKILFTKTISGNESMDLSTLSNGLYLIRDNNTHHVIKFIKE